MPQQLDEDTIAIRFKRPRRDGVTHVLLAPAELIGRMAALVPRPFTNSIIYSGVLSARSAWRADVVPGRPSPTPDSAQGRPCPSRRRRIPWATLLKRVFGIDPTRCDCGGRYRLVATIRSTTAGWSARSGTPDPTSGRRGSTGSPGTSNAGWAGPSTICTIGPGQSWAGGRPGRSSTRSNGTRCPTVRSFEEAYRTDRGNSSVRQRPEKTGTPLDDVQSRTYFVRTAS